MKKRFFIDMDGTLNEWNFTLPSYDTLYTEGYFAHRPPQHNIVAAVKQLVDHGEEVYILSAVLKDSKYALQEKHDWLDRYLPVSYRNRIFTICGEDKISFVPAFDPTTDILVDDYGENCKSWAENGGVYVKVSVNEADADHEREKHKIVIHPDMDVSMITDTLYHAGENDPRFFHIDYQETYEDSYCIEATSWDEARTKLDEMLRSHELEGPEYCIDSRYIYKGESWEGGPKL